MMRLRLSTGIVLVATLLSTPAGAHTPGLSMADLEVHGDGEVDARLTFSMATAEPLTGTALDRDHDGVITTADLSIAGDDLRAFVTEGVEVAADGSPCDGSFAGATVSEVDGLELLAKYACPPGASEVQITLYYLSARNAGPVRKAIARIVAGSATAEGVLTGERRALALRLPRVDRNPARLPRRLAVVIVVGAIAALVAGSARRWRAVRTAWQNRVP
jgi:hypothetical protein